MFTKHVYDTMRKFAPDGLLETYFETYSYENSEKKTQEVVTKVETSSKLTQYMLFLLEKERKPQPQELLAAINSITFFILSKAETICLGGLVFHHLWQNKVDPFFDVLDEQETTDMYINFILECQKMKLTVSKSFFDRYFRKIMERASRAEED